MSIQNMFEKLQLKDEKNILIQGLPSSIEKQFAKLSYSKSVTPLLRSRKIDFALVFAVNQNQLCNILSEVFTALHKNSKVWIAYPKTASKIASDLNRDCAWEILTENGYESTEQVILDHVWTALQFAKSDQVPATLVALDDEDEADNFDRSILGTPLVLEQLLSKHNKAKEIFTALSPSHKKEYVSWIEEAKRADTKQRRAEATLERLLSGKYQFAK
ncbi:MAG: hypothetical protein JWN76_1029 [Chitinophagaceae bacterium]|nr:hypothetical protein [Chitinophagaceae bacterium]